MKWKWIVQKFLWTFFLCEVLIFFSIQSFNLALRMDVIVGRIELGMLFFFIPFFAPLLLLILRNDDQIPILFEKICHFITAGLYLLCFLIFQINSWHDFVFSLNLTSFIWFLTNSMTTISLIITIGKKSFNSLFLGDENYNFNGKNNVIELVTSFLSLLMCVALVPLLKYPIFFYTISFSIHLIYGSLLRVSILKKDVTTDLNTNFQYLTEIWSEHFQNSKNKIIFVKALDRAFLVALYPIGWLIWADYWTVAMHPDYYFNVFYFLFFTPFLYFGWWLYRFRGNRKKISSYLIKHSIIIALVLCHFIGFNFLGSVIIGYSLGFLVTALRQKTFRQRVLSVSLIQILLILSFIVMLMKWVVPFIYSITIGITNGLIIFAVILFCALLNTFLFSIKARSKHGRDVNE